MLTDLPHDNAPASFVPPMLYHTNAERYGNGITSELHGV